MSAPPPRRGRPAELRHTRGEPRAGARSPHGLRRIATGGGEPRVASGIEPGIVRIEIDEAALNQEIAHFENIAPAPRVRHPGMPGSVTVHAGTRALHREEIAAGHD